MSQDIQQPNTSMNMLNDVDIEEFSIKVDALAPATQDDDFDADEAFGGRCEFIDKYPGLKKEVVQHKVPFAAFSVRDGTGKFGPQWYVDIEFEREHPNARHVKAQWPPDNRCTLSFDQKNEDRNAGIRKLAAYLETHAMASHLYIKATPTKNGKDFLNFGTLK